MGETWRTDREHAYLQEFLALASDVVHRRAGLAVLALDHVGDRRRREDVARGGCRVGEDPRRLAPQRAVEQLDELQDRDVGRLARERVAALDAALGAQDARPAQDREELLEELDR